MSEVWHLLIKPIPNYVIDAINCTTVLFFLSVKLLTSEDAKLERMKFAIYSRLLMCYG